MSETFHGWGTKTKGGKLEEFEFDPGKMKPDQVQIKIESCGICHSDISLIDNDWGNAEYPLVPGHEVIGIIEKVGDQAKGLSVGD
ncbi:MAG: alcohol dehydrogenase catalytic domain-containing protein, partial [Luteolibacter sp.]